MNIISWYTSETEYENVMYEYLQPSLNLLKLPYKIYPMDSLGDWRKNTCLKPIVIEKAFEDCESDLLIIDADAKIYDQPKLLEEIPEEYDCAMFWLDWNEWYQNGSNNKELCSGTLYLRNRPICRELIRFWKGICLLNNLTDQKALEETLESFEDLKIFKLPYSYCWINSLPGNREPFVKKPKNVIVEHFQKSRELKRRI